MKRNPETGRFYPLRVDFSVGQITLWDVLAQENPTNAALQSHVIKTPGLYNQICREYWYEGSGNSAIIFMASDAVVHQIDKPLYFKQLTPWREQLNKIRRK